MLYLYCYIIQTERSCREETVININFAKLMAESKWFKHVTSLYWQGLIEELDFVLSCQCLHVDVLFCFNLFFTEKLTFTVLFDSTKH